MKLSDKIRYLREVEGSLRGLDRAMTQQELVRAIEEDQGGKTISQPYLSQIESGARPHLTNTTRLLLARFFKVHPGYLVEDPEDYQAELRTLEINEDKLDLWLIAGAERFGRKDGDVCRALLAVAHHEDSRRCLLLLESILKTPALVERLDAALHPKPVAAGFVPEPAAETPLEVKEVKEVKPEKGKGKKSKDKKKTRRKDAK